MTENQPERAAYSVWLLLKTISNKRRDRTRKIAVWAGSILVPPSLSEFVEDPLRYGMGVPVYQEFSRASSLSRSEIYSPTVAMKTPHQYAAPMSDRKLVRTQPFMKSSAHSTHKWNLGLIINGFSSLETAVDAARFLCRLTRGPAKLLTLAIAFAEVYQQYKLYADWRVIFDCEPVHWRYVQSEDEIAVEYATNHHGATTVVNENHNSQPN